MGKGQCATPPNRITEEIVHPHMPDLPKTSASHSGLANDALEAKLAMVRHTKPRSNKPSAVIDRRRKHVSSEVVDGQNTTSVSAAANNSNQEESELDQVPTHVLITTYFSYLLLIAIAHIRDFFGKLFYPSQYKHLKEANGYAPMVSNFESLWSRRLYTRISDCFNRPITGVASSYVTLLDRVSEDHNKTFKFTGSTTRTLNLASYNYLGFAQSSGPCADEVERAIRECGICQASPRIEAGQTRALLETEELVACFVGAEDALLVSMGYATNSLTIPALVGKGCLIISDEFNHSSIVSGARLSGATILAFKHNDVADLEKRSSLAKFPRASLVLTVLWKKILGHCLRVCTPWKARFANSLVSLNLKKRYKFYLFVDEAHSIGAVGPRGRGVCDYSCHRPSRS